MASLKTRITELLPRYGAYKNATVNQITARLNSSRAVTTVAKATVRGRLSELVAANIAASEPRESGSTGFYLNDPT